jgi:CDP-glycerol glycerophosphotransferase
VTELMLVSDGLLTDYSSVMFDYALLDRPLLFFAPDADSYGQERGTYFDLARRAPGPFTVDQDSLFAAVEEFASIEDPAKGSAADGYAEARKQFAHDFGEYDTGTAADQVVARFFSGKDFSGKGGAR